MFRKKESEAILALIAAGASGLSVNSLKLHSQTLRSMKRRKVVFQESGRLKIHPKVEAAIAKDAEREANRKEVAVIKKRIAEADFLVDVAFISDSCTVSLLTDTGRLYKITGSSFLEAAKGAFEAKDRHEALKEELNTWRNF